MNKGYNDRFKLAVKYAKNLIKQGDYPSTACYKASAQFFVLQSEIERELNATVKKQRRKYVPYED